MIKKTIMGKKTGELVVSMRGECRRKLREILGLSAAPILKDVSGAFGQTFHVDDDYFIKIARTALETEDLRKEAALSSFLQEKLPVQVPKIELHQMVLPDESGREKMHLCGISRCIKGQKFYEAIRETEHKKYASAQLAEIMTALHRIDADTCPPELPDFIPFFDSHLGGKDVVAPSQTLLAAFLSELMRLPDSAKPVLCHGDWNLKNLIVNPKTRRIVGLLDFGMSYKGPYITDVSNAMIYHNRAEIEKRYVQPIVGPIPVARQEYSVKSIVSRYGLFQR